MRYRWILYSRPELVFSKESGVVILNAMSFFQGVVLDMRNWLIDKICLDCEDGRDLSRHSSEFCAMFGGNVWRDL